METPRGIDGSGKEIVPNGDPSLGINAYRARLTAAPWPWGTLGHPAALKRCSPTRRKPMKHRYRQEPLPVDGAEPREWSPLVQRTEKPAQGWLSFNDGSQLGPLFNTTTTEAK